jgi:thiamine-phosphate pyrophosphorylase
MRLKNGLLYGILDSEVIKKNNLNIYNLAEKLAAYGVDILQFRFKNLNDFSAFSIAQKLAKIVHKKKRIFIVNDRIDIAYFSGADGVHLGSDDLPISFARKFLGERKIIGKTIHSKREFDKARKEDVNYLSLGPAFKTNTKPNLRPWNIKEIKKLLKKTKRIVFIIGGIDLNNFDLLLNQGVKNIAVCRGLILSKNLKNTVKAYKKCLKKVS